MAYTYLEMLNLALREVNEVPLTETTFNSTRGLQQFAKESVNRAYFDISNQSTKWPWLQTSRALSPETVQRPILAGQQWYDIDDTGVSLNLECDWNTFLITEKDITSTDPEVIASIPEVVKVLPVITYDTWIAKWREIDFVSTNQGEPNFVIKYTSGKYGFTPVPSKNYWAEFNVSKTAVRFTQFNDVIPFPEEFSPVLLARIKYYLWLFRENDVQANFSKGEYTEGVATMKRVLLSNKEETMRAI